MSREYKSYWFHSATKISEKSQPDLENRLISNIISSDPDPLTQVLAHFSKLNGKEKILVAFIISTEHQDPPLENNDLAKVHEPWTTLVLAKQEHAVSAWLNKVVSSDSIINELIKKHFGASLVIHEHSLSRPSMSLSIHLAILRQMLSLATSSDPGQPLRQITNEDIWSCGKCVAEHTLLNCTINRKPALKRVIVALRLTAATYEPTDQMVLELIKALNKRNFQPLKDDKSDYKQEILRLLRIFNERKPITFSDDCKMNFKKYFEANTAKYLDYIRSFSGLLADETMSSEHPAASLKVALSERLEFLVHMSIFAPNVLKVEDVTGLLAEFDDLTFKEEEKITKLDQSIKDLKGSNSNSENIDKLSTLQEEIQKSKKQVRYLRKKVAVAREIDVSALFLVLERSKFIINDSITSALMRIGAKRGASLTAAAMISLVKMLPKSAKLEIPDELCANLVAKCDSSEALRDACFELSESLSSERFVKSTFLDYFLRLVIDFGQKPVRMKAFKALSKHKNQCPAHIIDFLSLEEQCLDASLTSAVATALKYVQTWKKELSLSCYEKLSNESDVKKLVLLCREVAECDCQRMPLTFVEHLLARDIDLELTLIFVTSNYVRFSRLKQSIFTRDALANDEIALSIVFAATQNGDDIPENIRNELQKLSNEACKNKQFIENLLDVILRDNRIDRILTRYTLEDRRREIANASECSRTNLRMLEAFVERDFELASEAFSKLVEILPSGYSAKHTVNVLRLARASSPSSLTVEQLAKLVLKDDHADCTPLVEVIIQKITESNRSIEQQSVNIITEIYKSRKYDAIYQFALTSALNTKDTLTRRNLLKLLKINISASEEHRFHVDNLSFLLDLKYDVSNAAKNQENALKINFGIIENKTAKYAFTDENIRELIQFLIHSDKSLRNCVGWLIAKICLRNEDNERRILTLISTEFQGLSPEKFTEIIEQSPRLRSVVLRNLTSVSSLPVLSLIHLVERDAHTYSFDELIGYALYLNVSRVIISEKLMEKLLNLVFTCSTDGELSKRKRLLNIISKLLDKNNTPAYVKKLKEFLKFTKSLNFSIMSCLITSLKLLSVGSVSSSLSEFDMASVFNFYKPFLSSTFEKFEKYFSSLSSWMDKLKLMSALNEVLLATDKNESSISAILSEYSEASEWIREMWCSAFSIIVFKQSKDASNQILLAEFAEGLKQFQEKHSSSFSDLIASMIDKQAIFKFDIESWNHLLACFLDPSEFSQQLSALFLETKFSDVEFIGRLRSLFLKIEFEKYQLGYDNELLFANMNQFTAAYSLKCIKMVIQRASDYARSQSHDDILSETQRQITLQNLLWLFSTMHSYTQSVSVDLLQSFLESESSSVSSISQWMLNINKKLFNQIYLTNTSASDDSFSLKLLQLFDLGWSFASIQSLASRIEADRKSTSRDETACHLSLSLIHNYKLKEFSANVRGTTVLDVLLKSKPTEWVQVLKQIATYNIFPGKYQKKREELIDEILELNKNSNLNTNDIRDLIGKIDASYDNVKHWTSKEIKAWAISERGKKTNIDLVRRVAVLKRAVSLTSKFLPRDIQVIALLVLLQAKSNGNGRLVQVNTGEGKTTTVAMLAVLKVLEGHRVDVITSSPELARPQATSLAGFYKLFEISVDCNEANNENGAKKCYMADVVYGCSGDFQGDILRDEYSKLGTMNGRKSDVAIIDEVDSMLIDGKNHIVMLSSSTPGMDYLEHALASIWLQIKTVADCIQENNGQYYLIEPGDRLDEKGCLKQDALEKAMLIETTLEKFLYETTEAHMRKVLRDTEYLDKHKIVLENDHPKLVVPQHLRQVILHGGQLKKWIESAIYARYRCRLGHDYILLNNSLVAPVDATNTGVVQENMHWNNGLHQFLQIKHGAKIKSENFTTNFISNVTFFQRYKSNIYGLTGTLGSSKTQDLLSSTYSVDCVIIPSFSQRQHFELAPIICKTEQQWYESICQSCIEQLKLHRAVLVITKYIREAEKIEKMLCGDQFGYDRSKVRLFRTNKDSDVIRERLSVGQIIIATNIAGRGTDIIPTLEVESHGGMHVCVTFVPMNERVQRQNTGRTSRTGNRGTSQFVVFEPLCDQYAVLELMRDEQERVSIEKAKKEIANVTSKDAVFKEFCQLLDKIKNKVGTTDLYIEFKLKAIEERFAIWLKTKENLGSISESNDNKDSTKVEDASNESAILLSAFKDEFEKEILDDFEKDQCIRNSFFFIECGNFDIEKYEDYSPAIYHFTRAIQLDNEFTAANAYYARGYARIAWKGSSFSSNPSEVNKAVEDFREAKKRLESLEITLGIIQQASDGEMLSEQVLHKKNLINVQKGAIDRAIGSGDGYVEKNIKQIEKKLESETLDAKTREGMTKQIKEMRENKRSIEEGSIGVARSKGYDLQIAYLDIPSFLPDDGDVDLYKEELQEFQANGFRGSFQVTELAPINWWSVIGLALIGLGQILAGAAIAVFTLGAGSSIGMGMITEGVGDLITTVKSGIINRDFSWASYGIQKAISYTVSLVCAGLGAIKDAAKTVYAGAKTLASGALNMATTVAKDGWKLAAKCVGVAIAKGVAKEIVSELADYTINKAFMPNVNEAILNRIQGPIVKALENNSKLKELLEVDAKNRNAHYQNLVKNKVLEMFRGDSNEPNAMLTIVKGIALGIAKAKIAGLSTAIQIYQALEGLSELTEALPKFIEHINNVIETIYNENNQKLQYDTQGGDQLSNILVKTSSDSTTNSSSSSSTASTSTSATANLNYAPKKSGDISLKKTKEEEDEDDNVKAKFAERSVQVKNANFTMTLTNSLSSHMSKVIQAKMVAPASSAAINFGMKKITAGLDKHIEDSLGTYQAKRRIEFMKRKDDTRVPKKYKEATPAQKRQAQEIINKLADNGEAGFVHMDATSEAINAPIRVYEKRKDGKEHLVRIIGEHLPGNPVDAVYQAPSDANSQGHWTLPGSIDAPASGTQNNCFFDVIASQTTTPCNADKLRSDTVQRLRDNIDHLASQVNDINRLSAYERNALQYGGASYMVRDAAGNLRPGGSEEDARQIRDNSHGKLAPLNDPTGPNPKTSAMRSHPEGHRSQPSVPISLPANEIDSVENYSMHNNSKTGFMDEDDQLFALDRALRHPTSVAHMNNLNNMPGRSYREFFPISINDLITEFPADANRFNSMQAGEFLNGTLQRQGPIKTFYLLLKHHIPPPTVPLQANDPVNLATFYPEI